jgi:DNA topoisomerase I
MTVGAEANVPGLRYVSDEMPAIRRRRAGRGFSYLGPDGKRIRNKSELERIRSIVIPPAWTDVWICPVANGHILAMGRDAKGRKQYRYHPRWRSVRDGAKFDRLPAFGDVLGTLRRCVRKDMALTGLPKEKVVATVVALLDCCFARVGNEQYARSNGSFGLTTLRARHAKFDGSTLRLRYKGKAGKEQVAHIDDKRIVYIVRKCQEIPGQELFQCLDDDGNGAPVGSADVNDYLRDLTGAEFSAKDFRTWAGTVSAARVLSRAAAHESQLERDQQVVDALDEVASELGNTRAVCRSCYVHPDVIEGYLDGSLARAWERRATGSQATRSGLNADERFVVSFLRSRARSAKRGAA